MSILDETERSLDRGAAYLDRITATRLAGLPGLPDATENPEAERAVIAAIVRNPDPQAILRLKIRADLFTQTETRNAISAILALLADGIAPDAVTLKNAVSAATRIEIETSLTEHASPRLPAYVKILERCWRERSVKAIRQRLAHAVMSGSPPHEIDAITATLRQFEPREPGSDDDLSGGAAEPRFTWAEDFCALPPDEEWLIEGYLEPDALSVLFGDSESYKSFLMIDLACHIATGKAWRGHPVRQGLALYIAGEGANGLKKRMRAWFEYHRLPMRNIAISRVPLALCDPKNAPALVADIRTFVQRTPAMPSFIALDTLNTHFGPGDESSTADMTKYLSGMREIRLATSAHVMTSHHCGHGDKTRSRGSIVLHNGVDWEYRLERKPETRLTTLINTKSKDADKPRPLTFELEVHPLPWVNNKGEPLTSGVLIPADDAPPEPPRLSRPQRIALEALRQECARHDDGWAFVADWRRVAADMGISPAGSKQACSNAFSRAVEALSESRLVVCQAQKYQPAP